jgi:hypothetical protein
MAVWNSSSGLPPDFFLDMLQSAVNNALGHGFFAALHDDVHELGQFNVAKLGVGQNLALGDFATTWHVFTSLLQLARWAP